MKAVVSINAITSNVSAAKLKCRLVFRAPNASPWWPCVCVCVFLSLLMRRRGRNTNSLTRQNDYYLCGCFQRTWKMPKFPIMQRHTEWERAVKIIEQMDNKNKWEMNSEFNLSQRAQLEMKGRSCDSPGISLCFFIYLSMSNLCAP